MPPRTKFLIDAAAADPTWPHRSTTQRARQRQAGGRAALSPLRLDAGSSDHARLQPHRHRHCSGLGTRRWVVEQTIALLHWFRRLRIRWDIRDDIHEAFLTLACAIICWRRLQPSKS
ncbi:hypothetical protein H9X94_17045 [Micromonospora aurantiaca]|nr:hypothetical protein [Micromonospora aurantiaca]